MARLSDDTRTPAERDRALQADPELKLSGGRASGGKIGLVLLLTAAIIALVIYGLAQEPSETAGTPPSQSTAGAPSTPAQDSNTGQQTSGNAGEQSGQAPANPQPARGVGDQGQPGKNPPPGGASPQGAGQSSGSPGGQSGAGGSSR
jgi:hypothetical protein